MKKFSKDNVIIFLILFFLFLFFYKSYLFKKCILDGCTLFFQQVFPSLFPMFLINDLLQNYHFFTWIDWLNKKFFHTSTGAIYLFIMAIFSGTPTNGYIASRLVQEKKLSNQDAGVILSYAFFLNPLFLYNMLLAIFPSSVVLQLIAINYGLNFLFFLLFLKYPYQKLEINMNEPTLPFIHVLSKSIERSFQTFIVILGTIIFYFILCEGVHLFFNNALFDCILNGILEATGGLSKLASLNISFSLKKILASIFISFGGFSIHTQIKNIISDASIPYKSIFISRVLHAVLSAGACYIIL